MRPLRADLRVVRPDGCGGQVVDVPTDEDLRSMAAVLLPILLDVDVETGGR
jgi:hypothetical protein